VQFNKTADVLEGGALLAMTEELKFILIYSLFIKLGADKDALEKNLIFHQHSKFHQAFI
jgi:hypothetical protein